MAKNLSSKIEKPWAVYGAGGEAWDIGLIHSLSSDQRTGHIIYTEGQYYPPELWDMDYVKIFKTSNEATEYFLKHQSSENRFSKVLNKLLINFPKAMKRESIQNLYDLLVSYKNKLSSQSSPKCTGTSENEKVNYVLEQSNIC
jgi:hypothetical protein